MQTFVEDFIDFFRLNSEKPIEKRDNVGNIHFNAFWKSGTVFNLNFFRHSLHF